VTPADTTPVVHDLELRSCTTETRTYRRRNVVQGLKAWRERRADVRRQRLVEAQLAAEPGTSDAALRSLGARAKSLWCSFMSGLG
jgi:hypothetical protein